MLLLMPAIYLETVDKVSRFKSSEHKLDLSDEEPRFTVPRIFFIVDGEASCSGLPGKSAFHNPAFG